MVPIVWVAGWAPGAVSPPTGIRSSDRLVCSESLYRLSYDGPRGTDDNLQTHQVSWSADRKRKLYLIFRSVRVISKFTKQISIKLSTERLKIRILSVKFVASCGSC